MKPRPPILMTVKWGGAAATLLLLSAWIVSGWYSIGYRSASGSTLGIRRGCFARDKIAPNASNQSGLRCTREYDDTFAPARWRACWWVVNGRVNIIGVSLEMILIPIWMPAAGALLLTAGAWRLDALATRRVRRGICTRCHYDRAGVAGDAKCPECGANPAVVKGVR